MSGLTLIEAAKLHSGDVLRSAIIEMYAKASPLLSVIPLVDIPGNAYRYNREETLPAVAFRGVNEAYTPSAGVVNPLTEPLVIAGGEVDVDKFIVDTMGADQRAVHESMKVKALSKNIEKSLIKGDSQSDPREFDGLQARVTGDQLVANSSASGGGVLSLFQLDTAIDQCEDPTHLVMNKTHRRRLSAAARTASVGGDLRWEKDDFGRQVAVYNDLPILEVDKDETGTDILPFTETGAGGGTAQCASIYVVSFQEGMCHGIQNGDMDVRDLGELETAPKYRTRIEWYVGLVVLHGRSVVRLSSIKDGTATA